MIDNDTINMMMGGKPKDKKQSSKQSQSQPQNNWEADLISGFKNKVSGDKKSTKTNTPIDPMNPSLSGADLEGIGNKLKNVPPFLLVGIVLLVVPAFYPKFAFLSMVGMICIGGALFDKVIPKETKEKTILKIKTLWIKFKIKRMEKQLEKENNKNIFNVGDKVTYVTPYQKEKGIVKSLSDEECVFVVYHCNNEWNNYFNYTAARTKKEDLVLGWI